MSVTQYYKTITFSQAQAIEAEVALVRRVEQLRARVVVPTQDAQDASDALSLLRSTGTWSVNSAGETTAPKRIQFTRDELALIANMLTALIREADLARDGTVVGQTARCALDRVRAA